MSIERLDALLLDSVFQKLGDRFTDWTGKSVFILAFGLFGLSNIILIGVFLKYHVIHGPNLFVTLSGAWLAWRYERLSASKSAFANHLRIFGYFAWMRTAAVLLGIAQVPFTAEASTIENWSVALAWVGFTLALYFLSCMPKPPPLVETKIMPTPA